MFEVLRNCWLKTIVHLDYSRWSLHLLMTQKWGCTCVIGITIIQFCNPSAYFIPVVPKLWYGMGQLRYVTRWAVYNFMGRFVEDPTHPRNIHHQLWYRRSWITRATFWQYPDLMYPLLFLAENFCKSHLLHLPGVFLRIPRNFFKSQFPGEVGVIHGSQTHSRVKLSKGNSVETWNV